MKYDFNEDVGAAELRDRLGSDGDLTQGDLTQALMMLCSTVSRLEARVGVLEGKLEKAQDTAQAAARTASCLANGIQPD